MRSTKWALGAGVHQKMRAGLRLMMTPALMRSSRRQSGNELGLFASTRSPLTARSKRASRPHLSSQDPRKHDVASA